MQSHIDLTEFTSTRPSAGEALARLEAEAALIRRHAAEYARLMRKHDHIETVKALVGRYTTQYGELVRERRLRLEAARAVRSAA